jgi:hypothetical protein
MIIGEATRSIDPALRQQHPAVPWRQIAGMRNILVHDYFRINHATFSQTVEKHRMRSTKYGLPDRRSSAPALDGHHTNRHASSPALEAAGLAPRLTAPSRHYAASACASCLAARGRPCTGLTAYPGKASHHRHATGRNCLIRVRHRPRTTDAHTTPQLGSASRSGDRRLVRRAVLSHTLGPHQVKRSASVSGGGGGENADIARGTVPANPACGDRAQAFRTTPPRGSHKCRSFPHSTGHLLLIGLCLPQTPTKSGDLG